jgi:membrane-associated protease RseP (regulator of RpoE activity)
LGVRSKRFALIAEDGVVKHVVIEEDPDQLTVTSAEALLSVAGVIERKARSAAAEMAVAAEIYKMKPLEALAFLKAQSATLLAAGMDADELNEAIGIVAGASGFASAAQGGTTEGGAAAEPSSAATIGAALSRGFSTAVEDLSMVYRFLQKLWSRQISARLLGGPMSILQQAGRSAEEGFSALLLFLTMLSANLAVVNFLPIPVLDGGHMVFLTYEWLRGKPPSEGVVVALSYLGLILILSLMLFVFGLDLGLIPRN